MQKNTIIFKLIFLLNVTAIEYILIILFIKLWKIIIWRLFFTSRMSSHLHILIIEHNSHTFIVYYFKKSISNIFNWLAVWSFQSFKLWINWTNVILNMPNHNSSFYVFMLYNYPRNNSSANMISFNTQNSQIIAKT